MRLTETGAVKRASASPTGSYGAGRRVLLAEDDEDMRAVLAAALRTDGFDVVEAQNGLELLDWVAPILGGEQPQVPVHVIVTDVQMPCVTGMEILAGLAELPHKPPVIVITGVGDDEMRANARCYGAVAVLDKPFELDALRDVLASLDPPEEFDGGF